LERETGLEPRHSAWKAWCLCGVARLVEGLHFLSSYRVVVWRVRPRPRADPRDRDVRLAASVGLTVATRPILSTNASKLAATGKIRSMALLWRCHRRARWSRPPRRSSPNTSDWTAVRGHHDGRLDRATTASVTWSRAGRSGLAGRPNTGRKSVKTVAIGVRRRRPTLNWNLSRLASGEAADYCAIWKEPKQ